VRARHQSVSPEYTPAHYRTRGVAEGLALAAGSDPTPEHLLVALVWRATGLPSGILHRLGIERTELVRALAERGIPVPDGEPDALDLGPRKRLEVPYDSLMTIVRELPGRLPDGAHFGFNLHNETRRAWIVGDEHVEAEPLVAAILAHQSETGEHRPAP